MDCLPYNIIKGVLEHPFNYDNVIFAFFFNNFKYLKKNQKKLQMFSFKHEDVFNSCEDD